MDMDFAEQNFQKDTHHPTVQPAWKKFIEQHPTALIISGFILLPFIIFGIVLLGLRVKNGSSNEVAITPTPTISISPTVSEEPSEEPDPTSTPTTAKKTGTPTPKTSPKATTAATATPGSTATPAPTKQANLYFHFISCTYVPTASGSASTKLDNTTFSGSSAVPDTALCQVVFQNSEDVETGEIWYRVISDSDKTERAVGKLKKGNYPNSEFKEYQEVVSLKKNAGQHEIKFEVNFAKLFPESNFDDNSRSVKYTVQ